MTEPGRYLLDTTVLIDISKSIEPATSLVSGWLAGQNEVAVCHIVVAEFFSGLPLHERREWDRFVARLAFWTATRDVAMQAGVYRHDYARSGIALSTTDALVAALAISRGATLVTSNVKDFPMPNLPVIRSRP